MANITTQTIRVDLSTDKVIPSAFTHQNDTARTLVFNMYNSGMPYTMTGNTVKFAYKSPIVNGQYSVIAGASMASGTVSGNKVTVTLPSEYTAISGVGMLTMIITPTSGTVRPVNIRLVVQKSADGDDTVLGASDWPEGLYDYMDNWLEENEPTEIANLKSDLNYISSVNTTWYDGYISSADGSLKPPTADAPKCSDFFPVLLNSKIVLTVKYSTNHYRNVAIYGYDSEQNFVGQIAKIEGGSVSVATLIGTVSNGSVKYAKVSFNGYNDVQECTVNTYTSVAEALKEVDSKVSSAEDSFESEIEDIKELVGNLKYQYLDSSAWEHGYFNWNGGQTALVKTASDTWYCLKVSDIPAGTYHYNKFCSLVFSFIENTNDGTIQKLSDIGVTETNSGNVDIAYPFNLYLSLNPAYFDKDTAMFADGNLPSEYVYGWYKDATQTFYVNAQGQTIWIVGEGYIPTIQGACDMASANDIIFIRCGTYTEQVSIWNKKLHLIGENKANTILIDHSGNYNTPPLEMSLGSLSNMTIIEDGSSPTVPSTDSAYNMAYCLHIEWTPPANEVFKIDNCDFINYIHSPLGCGLYQDYTVHFKDCTFRCEATNEGNKERGSFYFHSNINPSVTGQKIIAENCIISSAGQKWAVLLGVPTGANNTGSAEARFSGCTIWNDNVGTADSIAYFDTSGGADVLKVVHSCGNTVDVLNNW